jgi:hypothetical protein
VWKFAEKCRICRETGNEMTEADIKLKIVRLIDSQSGEVLRELYEMITSKVYERNQAVQPISALEQGYKEMSEDKERETEALEWIEGPRCL